MNEYKKLMNQINAVISDLDFYPTRTSVKFSKIILKLYDFNESC